jgi:predicted ATP-grasp superfamily ATP-dependent carboligase
VPRLDLLELLTDKRRQASYLSTLGVPIPCTRSPATGDPAGEMASSLDFPCLVKPAVSFLWHPLQRRRALGSRWAKAVLIQTADELRVALDAAHADGLEVIVQEFVPGGETRLVAFYGFFDETSAPLATFVARKLRQWPPVLGSGSYSVGCREPSVVDIAVTMLRRMRYQGMVNVEFKHDPRDGRFKLIEINCRSGNRLYLPVTSGIDLPWIAYSHLTGAPVRVGEPRDGLRWIDDTRDLAAFGHYRREQGLTPRDWARSAWTAESHAYFAADDPLPFLADLWRAGGALWKRRR